ncbi:MAG: cobalt ECF transporter T component CbiQ [Desulfovibrionaceae bacterium]|nr:cobalt ECF transporter T component CbiQ [Desulfovibrionaceae bacterium]MBF0512727.1 cobalt ECF transporter T component CbiQ [Desulfovibrionaceae bacterium]
MRRFEQSPALTTPEPERRHSPGHAHGHGHRHAPAALRAAGGAAKASPLDPALGRGPLSQLDPRVKLLAALAMSLATAACRTATGAALMCALGLSLVALSGVTLRTALGRAVAVNVFTAFMWVFLLWRVEFGPGGPHFAHHPEALAVAVLVTLKINAVFTCLLGCLGSTRLDRVLHAMAHLRLPAKLVAVFFLFHRYVHVIHGEYTRLRAAMRARCFTPRFDRHTYKSLGYLVGMILVRAWDRAERVYAAMLCRGFTGTFWLLDHFHWRRRDTAFGLAVLFALAAVLILDARRPQWIS